MGEGCQFPPHAWIMSVKNTVMCVVGTLEFLSPITGSKEMAEYLPGQIVERSHPETSHHSSFPLL